MHTYLQRGRQTILDRFFWEEMQAYKAMRSVVNTPKEFISLLAFVGRLALTRIGMHAHILPYNMDQGDVTVRLNRARYSVGLRTGEIVPLEEIYSEHVYDRLEAFQTRPEWIVVDVGANVGVFTLEQVRRGARVYAFEPNPDCYRRLLKMCVANRISGKVIPLPLAVGGAIGRGQMRLWKDVTVGGKVVADTRDAKSTVANISITTLDCILPALGITHIDLLKVDAEELEVEVLQGATESMKLVHRVIVEYHTPALRIDVAKMLEGNQFAIDLDIPIVHLGNRS